MTKKPDAKPERPDYLVEADLVWLPRRFRRISWLHFKKLPIYVRVKLTGEPATITGWRHAWFGISLVLYFNRDGRIEHGYDPATVTFL